MSNQQHTMKKVQRTLRSAPREHDTLFICVEGDGMEGDLYGFCGFGGLSSSNTMRAAEPDLSWAPDRVVENFDGR